MADRVKHLGLAADRESIERPGPAGKGKDRPGATRVQSPGGQGFLREAASLLAVCRALACQVLQLTVFRLFYGLALGRGGNTKTPKISALRVVTPQSPTAC